MHAWRFMEPGMTHAPRPCVLQCPPISPIFPLHNPSQGGSCASTLSQVLAVRGELPHRSPPLCSQGPSCKGGAAPPPPPLCVQGPSSSRSPSRPTRGCSTKTVSAGGGRGSHRGRGIGGGVKKLVGRGGGGGRAREDRVGYTCNAEAHFHGRCIPSRCVSLFSVSLA